eukprot:6932043-Pyramimonas_sp.AAC.1
MWLSPQRRALSFQLAWRRARPSAAVNAAVVHRIFARAPHGATNRARGAPRCVAGYTARTQTIGLSARD